MVQKVFKLESPVIFLFNLLATPRHLVGSNAFIFVTLMVWLVNKTQESEGGCLKEASLLSWHTAKCSKLVTLPEWL